MKKLLSIFFLFALLSLNMHLSSHAQDPHFSQYFSSPLTQAVDQNDPAMVKLLLERGANPFAQLADKLTVIDHVRDVAKFQTDTPEKKEIFDLLTSIPSPKS